MVVQEAKAKELNDKVVTKLQLLSLPLEMLQLAQLEKKLGVLLIPHIAVSSE
jgi:hypothetical protein